jgi:hypothetical protein
MRRVEVLKCPSGSRYYPPVLIQTWTAKSCLPDRASTTPPGPVVKLFAGVYFRIRFLLLVSEPELPNLMSEFLYRHKKRLQFEATLIAEFPQLRKPRTRLPVWREEIIRNGSPVAISSLLLIAAPFASKREGLSDVSSSICLDRGSCATDFATETALEKCS